MTKAAVVMTIHASLANPTSDAFEFSLPKTLSEMALPGEGRAEPMLFGPATRALMLDESRTDMLHRSDGVLPDGFLGDDPDGCWRCLLDIRLNAQLNGGCRHDG